MRRILLAAVTAAVLAPAVAFAGAFPDGPGGPRIAVVDHAQTVTQRDLDALLPVFQAYLGQVCEAWHCAGSLYLADRPSGRRDWTVTVNDWSDVDGAIGYHTTGPGGVPAAYVSAATAAANGVPWTVVFTHELAEMLVDAPGTLAAQDGRHMWGGTFYALEVADPVQGRSYLLHGVPVADFVYRSWFQSDGVPPYDAARQVWTPYQLATDSWALVFTGGEWTTIDTFHRTTRADWDTYGPTRSSLR